MVPTSMKLASNCWYKTRQQLLDRLYRLLVLKYLALGTKISDDTSLKPANDCSYRSIVYTDCWY
jgi:hypothetical protein